MDHHYSKKLPILVYTGLHNRHSCYDDLMNKHKRNDKLVDIWSLVHVVSSGTLAWLIGPVSAFVIVTLWEPFEILLLSPLLAQRGIIFGYESWRNSLSDIVFNSLGIGITVALQAI